MREEQLKMLEEYLKIGVAPILLENVSSNLFEEAIILNANCDITELNGHYEDTNFVAPKWYQELINKTNNEIKLLVINNINKISIQEQTKFIELLKYRKISTFELPKDCIILITCDDLQKYKINEEIYSLLIHI